MESQQRNVKEKTNGVKNARPVHVSETWEQIIILGSYLDLYLEFDDSGQLGTKIYDKRDDFNFKIINFPNMCSNIPASPAYGVYISSRN